MKILIGCEFSGVVRREFRARGHDAWSCDLLPAEDGDRYHLQMDIFKAIRLGTLWDMALFFPPCTFLCSSGLHWNGRRPARAARTEKAVRFVRRLWGCGIAKLGIENPIGCLSTRMAEPSQIIQPYNFGEDASKSTCLWLRGLAPLLPTGYVPPRRVCKCGGVYPDSELHCPRCGASRSHSKPRWANQTDSGQNKLGPSETRGQDRARTYLGIAKAMAAQWG